MTDHTNHTHIHTHSDRSIFRGTISEALITVGCSVSHSVYQILKSHTHTPAERPRPDTHTYKKSCARARPRINLNRARAEVTTRQRETTYVSQKITITLFSFHMPDQFVTHRIEAAFTTWKSANFLFKSHMHESISEAFPLNFHRGQHTLKIILSLSFFFSSCVLSD